MSFRMFLLLPAATLSTVIKTSLSFTVMKGYLHRLQVLVINSHSKFRTHI